MRSICPSWKIIIWILLCLDSLIYPLPLSFGIHSNLFSHVIKILSSWYSKVSLLIFKKGENVFFALYRTHYIFCIVATQLPYKSQLQIYAQKRGKNLPSYRSINGGSLRAPLFKSEVTIDGQTFESPEYFRTMKEAETAAAKVALMSLPQEPSPPQQSLVGTFIFLFTYVSLS